MDTLTLVAQAERLFPDHRYGDQLAEFINKACKEFPHALCSYLRVRVWGGGLSSCPTIAVGIDRDVVGPVGIEVRMQSPTAPLYWFARSHAAAVAHEWQLISRATAKERIKYLSNKARHK